MVFFMREMFGDLITLTYKLTFHKERKNGLGKLFHLNNNDPLHLTFEGHLLCS